LAAVSESTPDRATPKGLVAPCLDSLQLDLIDKHLRDQRFFWLDLDSPDRSQLARLGELLNLHPLTLDDAESFDERPKREHYEGYVYLVIYGVDPEAKPGSGLLREIHAIISGRCVVTIHRGAYAVLEEVRKRYADVEVRSEPYLVFQIVDSVLDSFVPVLSQIDDEIDEIEEQVISEPTEAILRRIFSLKRDLISMRRVVTPMRDFFARDAEELSHLPGMEPDDHLYFRDLYDGLVRTSDLIDSYRDLLSGATDMYLSTVANRQGEVTKQLAIIATIFLPLSFLTGFFGMNFTFLTGQILNHTWAFFALGLGLLAVSIAALWLFFRRKGWLST
jgi:magnesium transporter